MDLRVWTDVGSTDEMLVEGVMDFVSLSFAFNNILVCLLLFAH